MTTEIDAELKDDLALNKVEKESRELFIQRWLKLEADLKLLDYSFTFDKKYNIRYGLVEAGEIIVQVFEHWTVSIFTIEEQDGDVSRTSHGVCKTFCEAVLSAGERLVQTVKYKANKTADALKFDPTASVSTSSFITPTGPPPMTPVIPASTMPAQPAAPPPSSIRCKTMLPKGRCGGLLHHKGPCW